MRGGDFKSPPIAQRAGVDLKSTVLSQVSVREIRTVAGSVRFKLTGLEGPDGTMMTRRRFNRRERAALYLAAGGCCELCGRPLGPGWHADHIAPYARGGETSIENGQALCPECNLKKGERMTDGIIELRPFQEEFIDVAMRKAKDANPADKAVVANVHPGSGKTLACLAAADILFQRRYIDAVAVFVPRLNLAVQFEQDWEVYRHRLPWPSKMGSIYHSDNNPPLIYSGGSGYVTTYDSLVNNPRLHLREISSRRTLVIFDEAQQLGADYVGQHTVQAITESARWAQKVGERAQIIFVLSGTPFRADDSQLLFAQYDEPDDKGFMRLLPDVRSTYRDGVRDKFLRPFEAHLHDGRALWQSMGADPEELVLSELSHSTYRVITHPEYWQPLTDRFVRHLIEQKELVDPRLCGLVAANRQDHAREIAAYIRRKHPQMRVLIAVSDDGTEAHESLRKFREGEHDILVTVSMAYVGYDHKPISCILVLTSIRTEGYLRQLLARALRMWSEVEPENQVCYAFVPDDRRMRDFVDKLRSESEQGAQAHRDEIEVASSSADGPSQLDMGYVLRAWLTDIRARGINPEGDLTPEQYQEAERIRRNLGIPYPTTALIAFYREMRKVDSFDESAPRGGNGGKDSGRGTGTKYVTMREKMRAARSLLSKEAARTDHALCVDYGTTNKMLWRKFGCPVEECTSLDEIHARIRIVRLWREQQSYD